MQLSQPRPARKAAHVPLGDLDDFIECCADQEWFFANGWIELQTAVDNLQRLAELWGLVNLYGQTFVQEVIAFRPCAERAAPDEDYVRRIIKRWEAEDAAMLRIVPSKRSNKYRTPQSTIDAFWTVVRAGDTERLAKWLGEHPKDVFFLTHIWKRQCSNLAAA